MIILWYLSFSRSNSSCIPQPSAVIRVPISADEYNHKDSSKKDTVLFDEQKVCRACLYKEKERNTIDWDQREQELEELCSRYRSNDGSYDCLVPGSGGKDSVYQAWMLKYKYGMNPLTVTWSPHLYTDVGWRNFQSWIHNGGFDNFLFTPNGKVHRLLTRLATINLLHPFQPFIMGQKTFAVKMAAKFNIKLIFYGEVPAEYGMPVSDETSMFDDTECDGFRIDYGDVKVEDLFFGGISGGQLIKDYGVNPVDLNAYLPINGSVVEQKKIRFHYLGYFLKWDPQECYYFSVDKVNFEANPVRTEGTYSKYNSLDDKTDGFFYYTYYIKFGIGRAMQDSAQEVRNGKITSEEGRLLIEKFDGEFPKRYQKEFLEYVGLSIEEFDDLCDKFRSPHLWIKNAGEWKLRHTPSLTGYDD